MENLQQKYGLNDEQVTVLLDKSVTLLVNASAGSGKTRCLVTKIRHLLDLGEPTSSILAITFTNKAANEMKFRLSTSNKIEGMQVSTIHSLCVRIIREWIKHTKLRPQFSIYDDRDQEAVIKSILKGRDSEGEASEILSQISKAKSDNVIPVDMGAQSLGAIYKAYQEILIKNNSCDFDDLLIYAHECLKHEDCRVHYSTLWKHILVDEAQDTSTIQYEIITKMYDREKTKTFMLIGDENQSIYSFRGARPDNIRKFIREYSPSVINLTYNYRSCLDIINHANDFLQFGKEMVAKTSTQGNVSLTIFNDQEQEARMIADAIRKMGEYEETAILYRLNYRSMLFERALGAVGVPYHVAGDLPFFKRKVSRDMISYMKAANNPNDIESLVRIVNVPKRGFGEAKKEKLFMQGRSYLHELARESIAIDSLVQLLSRIEGMKPGDALKEILDVTRYEEFLDKESDQDMLNAFTGIAKGFNSVEELVLYSNFSVEENKRGVRLMTAHSSKGLEFDRVFVVGVEEGTWPHQRSDDPEEEGRLLYVSLTRARRYLNVSYSKSRLYKGEVQKCNPSPLFRKLHKKIYGKEL